MKGRYIICAVSTILILLYWLFSQHQPTHIYNQMVKMEVQGRKIQVSVITGYDTHSYNAMVVIPFAGLTIKDDIVVAPANKHAAILSVYVEQFGIGFVARTLRYFGIAYPTGFTLYSHGIAPTTQTMYQWNIVVMEKKVQ